jgi:excinuclease UvrABC ATPase subunit
VERRWKSRKGTPEEIADKKSYTAKFLKKELE